jgi:S1-C subfamily serine protease
VSWEDEDAAEDFRSPLPPEDRLWRHPAEVAAAQRAAAELTSTSTIFRTPWRHALTLALMGALGGALVVTGLFLTIDGSPNPSEPVTRAFALDPVVPVPVFVEADDWPTRVTEQTRKGVARISVTRGSEVYIGSAVAYRSDGMFLTSSELVHGVDEVTVTTSDAERHVGEVVGSDEISGLAVVRIDADDQPIVHLDIWSRPSVGQYAVVVSGSVDPDSLEMTTVTELQVQVRRTSDLSLHGMIELAGEIPPGGDGAAVVDTKGAVMAIAVDSDAANATHAVPITYARKIADDIAKSGTGRHPWIGVRGIDVSIEDQIELGIVGGVELTAIVGDPARAAGLREGDIITAVGDERVGSFTDLVLMLRQYLPGKVLEVDFERDGERHQTEVRLQLRETDGTA